MEIEPPVDPTAEAVTVDESLAKPPERPPDPPLAQRAADAVGRLIERGGVPAAILAFVAVVAGVAVALATGSTLVTVTVGLVLSVSLAAALLAVW